MSINIVFDFWTVFLFDCIFAGEGLVPESSHEAQAHAARGRWQGRWQHKSLV